jgi:hypothetical protein
MKNQGQDSKPIHPLVNLTRGTKKTQSRSGGTALVPSATRQSEQRLLLPGALLVPMRPEFLTPLMFIDFGFPTFLQ